MGVSTVVQVCSLQFDRKDIQMNKLVATSLEASITVFDVRTQHPTKGFASLTEKVGMVGGGNSDITNDNYYLVRTDLCKLR